MVLRLCNTCSILDGIAGALLIVVIPAFSAKWFPNHERTTATGIAVILLGLGIGGSFLLPSFLMPEDIEGIDDVGEHRWYIQRFVLIGDDMESYFYSHQ